VERIREAEAWAREALRLARSAGAAGAAVKWHVLVALAWARTLRGHPVGDQRDLADLGDEDLADLGDLGRHSSEVPEWSGLYESSIDRPAGVRLAFRGEVGPARAGDAGPHPWGLATADRCAAAIALASRYDEQVAAGLAAAAATLGRLGLGFDRARSLLWLGQAARRARKRAAARRFLEASATAFDGLGSGGWAEHARAELDRLGTRRPTQSGELTVAEQRVAALAADGLSNKEIARRLFVAVHTVEVHLARAYAKLGVRSRTQLASRLGAPASPQGPLQPPR
jgi:DNA-binding CsgD family transcriptional regulator